ncbi:MAG TPA: amino acid adenylation domain-containing protein [Acidimicrobiales bacterium]|nr:amino acid adenylation domain-containing protein [Acidimicrobiales bacterium]
MADGREPGATREVGLASVDTAEEVSSFVHLPKDRPWAKAGRERWREAACVDGRTADGLVQLASETESTPLTVVLAAFSVLLRRYGNDGDLRLVAFLTPDERPRPALAASVRRQRIEIGEPDPDASFVEVVIDTERAFRQANPSPPDGSQHVLHVEVGSSLHSSLAAGNARRAAENDTVDDAEPDLVLQVDDSAGRMEMTLEGAASIFDPPTVSRMMGHLRALLDSGSVPPAGPVARLPILSDDERRLVLVEWNETDTPFPEDTTVVAQVAEVAPERLAVVDGGGGLTYGEVRARAGRLAAFLHRSGAGRGDLVAVCMDRSSDLVVALLAVLEAGAAYVPLDAGYPSERLAYVLEDAAARILLTQDHLLGAVPDIGCRIVSIGRDDAEIQAAALGGPDDSIAPPRPDDPAYVIYTSGSTGRPKGSVVTHRSLMNLVTWHRRAYAVGVDDHASLVASVGFDASAWELWPYLAAGASVHVPDQETRASPELLWDWFATAGVTVTFLPTPVAELVIDRPVPANGRLRTLLTGGDRLRKRPSVGWSVDLVNHYGPTECTVLATAGRVRPWDAERERDVPSIGRPVDNVRTYLLDRNLEPVPVGVPGELFVGGAGVGLGYLNRPDLTAERFLPDPFSSRSGARLFRTGDLGRFRSDGAIEFLGRVDDQVKVRGFRVELGEVESVLAEHPGVKDTTVVAWGDGRARHLVGYVVPVGDRPPSESELHAHSARLLPSHMVPSMFVIVDHLPLTVHGKVDRAALPRPIRATGSVAARNDVEELLVGIWRRVLDAEDVGVSDDFFDLGGDSLLAVQMLAEVASVFNRRPTLSTFFERGNTIARLAAVLGEENLAASSTTQLVVVQAEGTRPPLFFVHPGEAGILALRHFTEVLGPDQPLLGLLPERTGRHFDPRVSIERLAAGLVTVMKRAQPAGPYHLCGYSFGGILAYEVARQLTAAGDAIAFLAIFDGESPSALRRAEGRSIRARRAALHARRLVSLGPRRAARLVQHGLRHRFGSGAERLPAPEEPEWDDAWLLDVDSAMEVAKHYDPSGYAAPLHLFCTWVSCWTAGSWDLGWGRTHEGPIMRIQLEGDHSEMLRQPGVRVVAGVLASRLRLAQDGDPKGTRSPVGGRPDVSDRLP